jgi:uncharacterized protein (DUF1499 family)
MTDLTDFKLLQRPTTPNTYVVLPRGFETTSTSDETSPVFAEDARSLFARVRRFVDRQDNWSIECEDTDEGQLEVVARTKLLRFKDDVSIRVCPAPEGESGSALAIYSRSRVGHGDLGANRKRVQMLLQALKQNPQSAA